MEQSKLISPKSSIERKRVVKILNGRNLIRKANISINIPQSIFIMDLKNYICLISIISPLKIQTFTINKIPNSYKKNKKLGEEPSAKKILL